MFLLRINRENKNFFKKIKLFETIQELIGVTHRSIYEEKEYEYQQNKSKQGDYVR